MIDQKKNDQTRVERERGHLPMQSLSGLIILCKNKANEGAHLIS